MYSLSTRQFFAFSFVLCATIVLSSGPRAEEHFVDGWCLAYDAERVTFTTDNAAANLPVPQFLVPSEVPTPDILDASNKTGWGVRYTKWLGSPFSSAADDACPSTLLSSGLIFFPPKRIGAEGRTSACPGVSFNAMLEPPLSDPLAGHVRIYCATSANIPNCTMSDRMPNGWEASLALPKSHLVHWRDASEDARAFFDKYLTDCGGK